MGAIDCVLGGDSDEVSPCYRNLLIAVEYHSGKWSEPAIAAAAAIKGQDHLGPKDWAELLDRIDAALRDVLHFERLMPRTGVRARYLGN